MSIRAGFFGKLPSRGDFVRGSLPRAVAAPWDQWLQSVLPAAQARLGGCWPDVWHAAQAWRFAFAPGVCGPQPVTGVWLPSVDRVGRTFPLMIAVQAAAMDDAFLAAVECAGADAIRSVMTPDMLADRLNRTPCPMSAASAASNPAARWWRRTEGAEGAVLRGDALPDADTFVRMLAA
jgi:type VI secretion system protein ImpM